MSKKSELILLIAVLVIAAFLRLYRIADYMTFLGDEGRDVLVVKRMIVDHKFTLLGPTASVGGFFLGPLYYYLMLPFLWAFRLNPVGPAVMVALFGIATVFLVYHFGRQLFNERVGLLAAFLYSISPLVISYSRSSWNPNVMPFFSLITVYTTWLAVIKKRPAWIMFIGFWFGLTFQIHYLASFLLVVCGLYLLINFSLRRNWQYYSGGVVGFGLGWLPFLIFELRHNFPNFRSLYKFLVYGSETGLVIRKFMPTLTNVYWRLFQRLVANNSMSLALVLIIISGYFIFIRRPKKTPVDFLLIIWLLIGVALFGFYQKPIYDYYFGFMFPLPFLLTAFGLVNLYRLNQVGKCLSVFVTCLLVWTNITGISFRYQPNRQLAQTKMIAREVLNKTDDRSYNFALITGQNSDHGYRYFLELWGRPPVEILNPQIDPDRKSVTDQLIVVCESLPCHPLGYSLWEIAGFGRAEIAGRWPVSVVEVYKLVAWKEK